MDLDSSAYKTCFVKHHISTSSEQQLIKQLKRHDVLSLPLQLRRRPRVQDGLTRQEAIKMKMMIMMKVTSHQPISEAPLDEERRESKGLTPGNPKEGKVPAARTPPLKGQYVCHSSIVELCRLSSRLYEIKLTTPLHSYCSGYSNNWSSSRGGGGGYRGGSRSAGRGSRPAPSAPAAKRPGFMALPTPHTAARPFLKPAFSNL